MGGPRRPLSHDTETEPATIDAVDQYLPCRVRKRGRTYVLKHKLTDGVLVVEPGQFKVLNTIKLEADKHVVAQDVAAATSTSDVISKTWTSASRRGPH